MRHTVPTDMTTETLPPRGTITRTALAVALLVLAGLIVWVGLTRSTAQPAVLFLSALLPAVAAALLFVRRGVGTALAVVAALLGALYGFLLSVCILCPAPPLSAEAVAIYVTAAVIYALALLELRTLGLVWIAILIPVAILALSGNQIFIAVAVVIAAVVVLRFLIRRRRPDSGAPPNES